MNTPVFWGGNMQIALPAATDIFLTGGKSHPSEILLARFIINHVDEGAHFLDIGAHYGYFSLLASEIVGTSGRVYSFEPATAAFSILTSNCTSAKFKNIIVYKEAVSDEPGMLTFYEFPNLYSEYNTMNVGQFGNEKWFKEYEPTPNTVAARTIDLITSDSFCPAMIKIDVEGAEDKAIAGGDRFLANNNPYVVMEYLSDARGNEAHKKAASILQGMGYIQHFIDQSGHLVKLDVVEEHLVRQKLDSDNIVFKK